VLFPSIGFYFAAILDGGLIRRSVAPTANSLADDWPRGARACSASPPLALVNVEESCASSRRGAAFPERRVFEDRGGERGAAVCAIESAT
jgi:hypothetical protein